MTEEQGKPIRMARNEVGYAADFLLWFAEEAKRVYGETIPSARADQRFLVLRQPVGVVGAITPWNYPVSMLTRKIGPGARRRLHHRAQAGRADAAAARSRCSRSSTRSGCPPASSTSCTTVRPGDRRPRAGRRNPLVRKITFTGSTEVGQAHRAAGRGGREAGEHGARRPRAVHRVRRRRPGARGEGRGGGEVPQHRPGVHLPEPHARAARHRRAVHRHHGGALRQAAGGQRLHRRRHRRPADRRRRAGEDGAPGGRRARQGRARSSPAASASPPTASTPATSTRRPCSPTSRPTC